MNQLVGQPDLVDVFPYSDRIVDRASVDLPRDSDGTRPIFVQIGHPWPPTEANVLEPAMRRLELLVWATTSHGSSSQYVPHAVSGHE